MNLKFAESDTKCPTQWNTEAAWRSRRQGCTIPIMKAWLVLGSPFIQAKAGALRVLLTYLVLNTIHFNN